MIEKLKLELHAKTDKLKRYKERVNQYKINRMFVQNQKRVYQQMDGIGKINSEKPNVDECKQFWSNIWDNEKEHERKAEWLMELRAERDNMKWNGINITTEMIQEQVKKIRNCKSPGPDGVQGYWLKKLILHDCIAKQMDDIINNREDMIWFPIPGYWKSLNLCKHLTTSMNLQKDQWQISKQS